VIVGEENQQWHELPEKEREKIFEYIDLIVRDVKIKKAHAA